VSRHVVMRAAVPVIVVPRDSGADCSGATRDPI
jgi:hypothetical protein